jgi:hypothetical protein
MKGNPLLTCALTFCALLLRASVAAQPTTLIVHHNANLRADHSMQSTIKNHLEPGDELTLVDPTKTLGFWHVRTADGVEGWVYQTLVHVEEVDEVPTVPPATGPVATAVDSTWDKPTPAGAPFPGPPGSAACPADGEAGGDLETNRRKNRSDIPATVHPVTFGALMALPNPNASTKRNNWTAAEKAGR